MFFAAGKAKDWIVIEIIRCVIFKFRFEIVVRFAHFETVAVAQIEPPVDKIAVISKPITDEICRQPELAFFGYFLHRCPIRATAQSGTARIGHDEMPGCHYDISGVKVSFIARAAAPVECKRLLNNSGTAV